MKEPTGMEVDRQRSAGAAMSSEGGFLILLSLVNEVIIVIGSSQRGMEKGSSHEPQVKCLLPSVLVDQKLLRKLRYFRNGRRREKKDPMGNTKGTSFLETQIK